MRNTIVAGVVVLAMVSAAGAASFIDWWVRQENIDGLGNTGYTLTYNPNPAPAEFLNLRLTLGVWRHTGWILDPIVADYGADCSSTIPIDTFVNTCYSAKGWADASYVFNLPGYYPAGGSNHTDPPTQLLDWSVYDTGDGDTDVYGPYTIARIITTPETIIEGWLLVCDTANLPNGETFYFPPAEPGTIALLGACAICVLRRRRAYAGVRKHDSGPPSD